VQNCLFLRDYIKKLLKSGGVVSDLGFVAAVNVHHYPSKLQINLCKISCVYVFIDVSSVTVFMLLYKAVESRRMRWAGHIAPMGEKRNASRILVGKPEGKRPLGRPRLRWMVNIKMDYRSDGMVWIGLICLRIRTSGGLL
jgi:hypothetical protein